MRKILTCAGCKTDFRYGAKYTWLSSSTCSLLSSSMLSIAASLFQCTLTRPGRLSVDFRYTTRNAAARFSIIFRRQAQRLLALIVRRITFDARECQVGILHNCIPAIGQGPQQLSVPRRDHLMNAILLRFFRRLDSDTRRRDSVEKVRQFR